MIHEMCIRCWYNLLHKSPKIWHQVHVYIGTAHLEIERRKEEGKGKKGVKKGRSNVMATMPKGYSTQRFINSDEVLVTYWIQLLLKLLLHLSFLSQQACDGTCIHLHVYRELYPSMAHMRFDCICLLVSLSVSQYQNYPNRQFTLIHTRDTLWCQSLHLSDYVVEAALFCALYF